VLWQRYKFISHTRSTLVTLSRMYSLNIPSDFLTCVTNASTSSVVIDQYVHMRRRRFRRDDGVPRASAEPAVSDSLYLRERRVSDEDMRSKGLCVCVCVWEGGGGVAAHSRCGPIRSQQKKAQNNNAIARTRTRQRRASQRPRLAFPQTPC
jgi:hypothetical protein